MREENVTPKLSPMVKSISRCFCLLGAQTIKAHSTMLALLLPLSLSFHCAALAPRQPLVVPTASIALPQLQTPPVEPQAPPPLQQQRRSPPVHLSLRGGAATLVGSIIATAESVPALVILAISIGLEVVATTCMKLAATSSPKWFIGVYGGYVLCFSIFPLALKRLPLSIAYATWSGVGTLASVIIGATAFGETITKAKLLWIAFIILGVVGLNC